MENNEAASTDFLLQNLESLPTLPIIVYELTELINDPMSSTAEIEKVMINDQSMTTKVLRLVNSAYYAIPGGVTSVSRAIAYLGFDTVNQLVLGSSIIESLKCEDNEYFKLEPFWQHSVGVAIASETIAKHIKLTKQTDIFTSGLVHDMGKIALANIAPEILVQTCKIAIEAGISMDEAEKQMGAPQHTEVGALLAKKWKLPGLIENVVRHHHQADSLRRGGVSSEMNQTVDIVMLANLLIHALKFGSSGHNKIEGAPKSLLERLSIQPDLIKTLILKIKDNLQSADGFLRVLGTKG
ncbi:MAG: HDOD domain-containing protein [Pseudomonadota bacterium]|nr:HDOD domain-containing protein [Pseudomonadota bacterium]